jgi:hypothetical protein
VSSPQQVNVTVKRQGGCLSGCGTVFVILFAIALLVTYWYVAVPIIVVAIVGTIIYLRRQPARPPVTAPAQQQQLQLGRTVEVRCAACGEPVAPTAASCPRCGNRL